MNICFICTGNTCRSPLAEGILKSRRLPGVNVRSAGLYVADGQPISVNSRRLLEGKGYPYTPSARLFSGQDAEWADLILTMTEAHRDTIRRMYEGYADKVFTLKEFTGDAVLDVMDPFGGSYEVYEQTLAELEGQIDVLARKLQEEQT
ncbi:low molecular weight protein arginine phosphatase [Sporosarcina sp. NCCP-2716]|uniref:low molecular weight protein arginine phosphatase n=1 Tax=Sporosarcina sp. NCCP-2716 TaxID=2943679 RepID=UPI0020403002|nr:low molecular weight protein arginine phosphatase [Sporosarcina sp. NCCP-2716]